MNILPSIITLGKKTAFVACCLLVALFLQPYIINNSLLLLVQIITAVLLIIFVGEFIPKAFFNNNWAFGKADLDYIIQQSLEEGQEKSDMEMEVKMLQNALDFSNIRLRDCIVPRTEIVACDTDASVDELKSKFIETGLSKIVIYNENIDDVIGYLHSSELFKNPDDWKQYIQTVPIVPETMAANKLMKLLMQDKKSMAIVVDEFGGTSGIVTLEDLVEEIFGEIEDEHDTKSHIAKKLAEDEYLLSGRIEIDAVNEEFELELPESDEYVTVAGFILHFHQKFPKLNETVIIGKYTFKIVKVTATKIELVRMKVT